MVPVLLTCQSNIRPTNGEMRVTSASAQATAWERRGGEGRRGEGGEGREEIEEW